MQAAEQGEKPMQTLAELQHLWEFWEAKLFRARGREEYQRGGREQQRLSSVQRKPNQMKNRTMKNIGTRMFVKMLLVISKKLKTT